MELCSNTIRFWTLKRNYSVFSLFPLQIFSWLFELKMGLVALKLQTGCWHGYNMLELNNLQNRLSASIIYIFMLPLQAAWWLNLNGTIDHGSACGLPSLRLAIRDPRVSSTISGVTRAMELFFRGHNNSFCLPTA